MQIFILFLLLVSSLDLSAATKINTETTKKPNRVLFMVFDQMRPDYVDRYDLKNFKRLRKMGQDYVNGYVGHSASVTVVSHAVMTTGHLPKDLPWEDDAVFDRDGLFGKPGLAYNTTALSIDQLLKGLKTLDAKEFLATALKKNGGQVIAIGEKNYAAIAMGGPYASRIITLEKKNGKCAPYGVNVPDYISKDERYRLECSKTYGTEKSFYPLDGNRYYPGEDQKHLGGDIWTADAALAVMKHENWSGLFLTFGAIDRIGHMTGEADKKIARDFETPIDLEQACHIADAQLGRILDELEAEKLTGQTLIISTADHGGQSDLKYLGNGKGETIGKLENDSEGNTPFWAQRLKETGLVRVACFDTGFRVWITDPNEKNIATILKVMKQISGITHIFFLDREKTKYLETYKDFSNVNEKFKTWANTHDLELANTMANSRAPDLIGFFEDNVGFDRIGDHGGAQEKVQRIPMLVYVPGQKSGAQTKALRLVDLKALILSHLSKD